MTAPAPAPIHAPTLGRPLGAFTLGKTVANTALRWVPPFLPTLERAFGATTAQLTTALGIAELGGLSTLAIGRRLDRGQERLVATAGLGIVTVACLVALGGTTTTFAIAAFLVVVGVANLTAAGHAWLGHRVPYTRRARAIGVFETSWALSLLVGAPIVAGLIAVFGWRGPYVALALAAAAAAVLLTKRLDRTSADPPPEPPAAGHQPPASAPLPSMSRLDRRAWATLVGAAFIAMSGLSIFAISGAWLDDEFGLSTGGLGAVAMAFGAIELASSLTSAGFADRLGKRRTTVVALVVVGVGLVVMVAAGSSLAVGVVGLLAFLCGFEYAVVTSFSLISEAMPSARGVTISIGNALGTGARGVGVIASGLLYDAHGIAGSVTLSAGAAVMAVAFLVVGRRPDT